MATDASGGHVIVGTAGHIDHGKTSLVRRLTGVDTDRLPEEKARGISIDLGFAHWQAGEFRFGVVDVPGHERFVKNMVAGATGIDLALLVVAADDGLMPQSIEHLEIMDLLGVAGGVVAITKIDAVEAGFVPLVEAELHDRLRGTFLDGCPVVPVSSRTGEGIACLADALVEAAKGLCRKGAKGQFRMPIDRVFSVAGHGVVVTGSVISGVVRVGETLELLPGRRLVRVRGLESHNLPVKQSEPGNRTAVNLAGVKAGELNRGDELAAPGTVRPTQRIFVRIRCLGSSPVSLRDRSRLNLHLGTREIEARLNLKGKVLSAGEEGYAELHTSAPFVAAFGQRFILRRPSPTATIAGGVVLDPGVEPRRRPLDFTAWGAALEDTDELQRLSHFLSGQDLADPSPRMVSWKLGIAPDRYPALIEQLTRQNRLVRIGSKVSAPLVHVDRLQSLQKAVLKRIPAEVERRQPRHALSRRELLSACRRLAPPELVEAAFDRLLSSGAIIAVGSNFAPEGMKPKLTRGQAATRAAILDRIAAGGLAPPTLNELSASLNQEIGAIRELLDLCVDEGLLIEIEDGVPFLPEALERARSVCKKDFEIHKIATVSQLRQAWGTNRRIAFALCQYFDARMITIRDGDARRAGPNIAQPM